MKMKFILLTLTLFTYVGVCANVDTVYYKAFQYIKDSEKIKLAFSQYIDFSKPFGIYISNKLLRQLLQDFVEDIVDYEYKNVENKEGLIDSLEKAYYTYEDTTKLVLGYDENLKLIQNCNDDCKLILYFTVSSETKFMAYVGLFDKYVKDKSVMGSMFSSPVSVLFLFYYENNEIEKVFETTLYH